MCIKCELLDTIYNMTKNQNKESPASVKIPYDRPKSNRPKSI